jgi:hypothetical protein
MVHRDTTVLSAILSTDSASVDFLEEEGMTRNPKLKKLKDRLTPRELERRRENMASKGSWRNEMELASAKQFGLINGLGQWLQKKDQTQRKVHYALIAHALLTLALAAKVFGLF